MADVHGRKLISFTISYKFHQLWSTFLARSQLFMEKSFQNLSLGAKKYHEVHQEAKDQDVNFIEIKYSDS